MKKLKLDLTQEQLQEIHPGLGAIMSFERARVAYRLARAVCDMNGLGGADDCTIGGLVDNWLDLHPNLTVAELVDARQPWLGMMEFHDEPPTKVDFGEEPVEDNDYIRLSNGQYLY